MPDIVQDLSTMITRIQGLEKQQLSNTQVARIENLFSKLEIRSTITIKKKYALFPSNTLYPSNDLYM